MIGFRIGLCILQNTNAIHGNYQEHDKIPKFGVPFLGVSMIRTIVFGCLY